MPGLEDLKELLEEVKGVLTPATLEEKLKEVRVGVENLNAGQIDEVDELIKLALDVKKYKQEIEDNPGNPGFKEDYEEAKAKFDDKIAEITDPKVAKIAKLIKEKSKEGDDLEEIEKRLEGLKKGVANFLDDNQRATVDKWIDLANEVQEKKKEAQNSTGFAKEAAEKAYQEKKAEFKKAMNEAIDGKDPKLAEIAKIIKKKSNNHDDFDDVQENLKSMFSLDKDQPFHKMTEGELLGEIIFRLLMLIFSGIMAGKYLASEKSHESDVEKLLRKANDATDPNQRSMYLGEAAQMAVVRVTEAKQAAQADLSSSSSASPPSSTSTPLFNVVPPASQPGSQSTPTPDDKSTSTPDPTPKSGPGNH